MKSHIPTLISIALLATLVIGIVFTQTMAPADVLAINVAFDPKNYEWNGTPPPWNAEIWRQKVQDTADYSTIRLEGTYSPIATPYPALHGPRLIVTFNGEDVKTALFMKLPSHMGILEPGTYKVKLTVSGYLKPEYGGTPFEGDGTIVVTVLPPPP
jgi:hypothetical protein